NADAHGGVNMTLQFPFHAVASWQITLALLHVCWIGLLIGGIAAVGNLLLRNSSASRRYWWSCLMMLALGLSLPATFVVIRSMIPETDVRSAVVTDTGVRVFPEAAVVTGTSDNTESVLLPTAAELVARDEPHDSPSTATVIATFRTGVAGSVFEKLQSIAPWV